MIEVEGPALDPSEQLEDHIRAAKSYLLRSNGKSGMTM